MKDLKLYLSFLYHLSYPILSYHSFHFIQIIIQSSFLQFIVLLLYSSTDTHTKNVFLILSITLKSIPYNQSRFFFLFSLLLFMCLCLFSLSCPVLSCSCFRTLVPSDELEIIRTYTYYIYILTLPYFF